MRTKLQEMENQRKTFTGIFERYGIRKNWNGYPEKTILLKNIRDGSGKVVTSHIWFKMTKGFEALGEINKGDFIKFDARVKEYIKGWQGGKAEKYGEEKIESDYRLSFPTRISRKTSEDMTLE